MRNCCNYLGTSSVKITRQITIGWTYSIPFIVLSYSGTCMYRPSVACLWTCAQMHCCWKKILEEILNMSHPWMWENPILLKCWFLKKIFSYFPTFFNSSALPCLNLPPGTRMRCWQRTGRSFGFFSPSSPGSARSRERSWQRSIPGSSSIPSHRR